MQYSLPNQLRFRESSDNLEVEHMAAQADEGAVPATRPEPGPAGILGDDTAMTPPEESIRDSPKRLEVQQQQQQPGQVTPVHAPMASGEGASEGHLVGEVLRDGAGSHSNHLVLLLDVYRSFLESHDPPGQPACRRAQLRCHPAGLVAQLLLRPLPPFPGAAGWKPFRTAFRGLWRIRTPEHSPLTPAQHSSTTGPTHRAAKVAHFRTCRRPSNRRAVPVPVATSLLGSTIYNSSSSLSRVLDWDTVTCGGSASGQGCGPQEAECVASLANDVLEGDSWALLYFPANFTASYLSWYPTSGVQPQQQQPLASYVIARGRDYSTYNYLSAVVVSSLYPGLTRAFTTRLAANAQVMQLLSPSFLASGLGLQQQDLAPVKNFGQHFATYIFCVLLWLGSSFVVVCSYQFKLRTELALVDPRFAPTDRTVRIHHLAWALLVKGTVAVGFMLVEMVLLCCVLWALGGGNEQWYLNAGHAIAFGWYLSWSFISINAVLLYALGIERFSSITALLLILQLTSASAILSLDLSNRFFYIGKGLPFFYGVRGFRTIFFGTCQNKMYINWLVLTAYNVVFMPLGLFLVARKAWSNARGGHANRIRPGQGRPAVGAAVGLGLVPVVA